MTEKFKIKKSTVYTALARGSEDNIGIGTGNHGKQKAPVARQPFEIGPFKFESKLAASKFLEIKYRTFLAMIRGNALARNEERLLAMFMTIKARSEHSRIREWNRN